MSMFEMVSWGMYHSPFKKADERYVALSLCVIYIGSSDINEKVISMVSEVTGFSKEKTEKILLKVFPNYVFERDRLIRADTTTPRPKTAGQIVRSRLSGTVKRAIKSEAENCCHWCGIHSATLEIDHVVPVSRGGTNDRSNLVASCKACNAAKGNKLVHEWIRE